MLLNRYEQDAVSVRRGGIVAKLPQWRVARKKWLLAVEDPQVCEWVALRLPDAALHQCTLCIRQLWLLKSFVVKGLPGFRCCIDDNWANSSMQ